MTGALQLNGPAVDASSIDGPALRCLREDLNLYPGPPEPGGESTWVLHDPLRNRFFNLGWSEFELLKRWSFRDPERIVQSVNVETPLQVEMADVQALDQFLDSHELLLSDKPPHIAQLLKKSLERQVKPSHWMLHRYLFFRIPLVHPDRFLSATLGYAKPFFSRGFRLLLVFTIVFGLYLVLRQWSEFTETLDYLFSFEGLIFFALALIVAKCLHELGHAYTCKYYGLKVPAMGVAFLVMWPFLYTDTTESWKLKSRRQRLAIGAAGMYAELSLAAFATLLWSFLDDGPIRSAAFFLATASWIITLLINTNPFMRWDGYYLLSDFLGVQNLQDRAFAVGRWRLREWLFGLGEPPAEHFSDRMRRFLIVYAYATWLYRFVLFLGIALVVYHFFFKLAGIVLLLLEVGWFIGMPIYRELKQWYDRRQMMRWNKNTITTFALSAGLLALFIIPWQSHIKAPALLEPDLHKTFYAPVAGRVLEARAESGQAVEQGELLFIIASPELDYELEQVRNQIHIHRTSLGRIGTRNLLEAREVIQQKLQEAITAYQGYREQMDQLQIRAPFSGEVVWVEDALTPGRWVSNELPLASIVDKRSLEVNAYVTEDQLGGIRQKGEASFHPENPKIEKVRLEIKEIDTTSTRSFSESPLVSVFGGDIAVRENADGELTPQTAVYRVRLGIDGSDLERLSHQVLRGTVHMAGDSRSILDRIWLKVSSVLIRESGF